MGKYFSKEKFYYLFRVLTHPLDGFYEIRHREKGSVPLSFLCTVLFGICYTFNRIFASFIVADINPLSINGLTEVGGVFALFILICVGNWSITCLMEGEGRLKDIVTVVGYGLLPLILTYVPATIISQFIASGEEVFYTLIIWVGTIWAAILMLMGIMTVHNYTFVKTLVTLALTVVAVFIIIFVALMLLDLINQVYTFLYSIYTELIYRY